MESNNTNHRLQNSLSNTNDKDNLIHFFKTQENTIFQYLQNHTATASMVADATGVPQKSICRYKRDLEKHGLLFEVEKKICKISGFRAWYLTTNKDLIK
jgi:hypothetical protein